MQYSTVWGSKKRAARALHHAAPQPPAGAPLAMGWASVVFAALKRTASEDVIVGPGYEDQISLP